MKRQKMVYTNSQLPHIWAHQSQSSGRNGGGNLYFEGATIYSYGSHFPIASVLENKAGQRGYLFTTEGYSMVTAQHKNDVRRAIPSDSPTFYVPLKWTGRNLEACLTWLVGQVNEAIAKAAKGIKTKRHEYYKQALHCFDDLEHFSNFYGLVVPYTAIGASYGELQALHESWGKIAADLDAARFTPEAIAKRDADREKRQKQAEAKAERERIERIAKYAQAAEDWKAGKNVGSLPYDLPTMLRIEGDNVVTSRGASFPLEHGLKAVKVLSLIIDKAAHCCGTEECLHYAFTEHKPKLGNYTIDSIECDYVRNEKDYVVHAGCHKIYWSEIKRVAALISA